ncbi:DUF192 domain-containing protein [Roseiarcus sp.]|uniref:DUF192 domain-containing protein n=1 Tax=Roseiarcus sp. TaxID=1969460 RepID=UPI003F9D923E
MLVQLRVRDGATAMRGFGVQFRAAVALLVLSVGLNAPALAQGLEPLRIVTASGAHDFRVEIAADDASRERGLMNRRFMPADHGMLFEFPQNVPVSFWMKNTYIPLDMIFLSPAGVVTNIVANAEPLSERVIPSGPPCVAVLEVNGGVAASLGMKVGDRVQHAFFKP